MKDCGNNTEPIYEVYVDGVLKLTTTSKLEANSLIAMASGEVTVKTLRGDS